jgi:hypothetical protein
LSASGESGALTAHLVRSRRQRFEQAHTFSNSVQKPDLGIHGHG